MDELPDVELLEAVHRFPCRFTFKAIGLAENHFVGRVLAAVRECLPEAAEPPFSSRATSNGKHVSVTIEPEVESAERVIEIYRSLRAVEGLVMLM